jgi:HKD family nuclease
MRFIANIDDQNNHFVSIAENLKLYDEAFFAVAFLKSSGIKYLIPVIEEFLNAGGKLSIIAGQNFALTEPKALYELRRLFENFPKSKLFLAKANSVDKVFHPKLYLFKKKDKCCVISGSANITQGGLIENAETSLLVYTQSNEDVWINSKKYFEKLQDIEHSNEASLLVIKQYETFFEQQKQYNKNAKAIPTKSKSQLAFDYNNLIEHFKAFDNTERQQQLDLKMSLYKEAKTILNRIADNKSLSQKEFEPLLDRLVGSKNVDNLWHSGSLFRLRRSVYPYYKNFQDLVRFVRDNRNKPVDVVFEKAKDKVRLIKGAGENYITEIMMTYNFLDFANLNKNPITVLKKEGGVNIKASSSSFNGNDYHEYCELIKEICANLGLKNMLEADSFFNEIYWEIKLKR